MRFVYQENACPEETVTLEAFVKMSAFINRAGVGWCPPPPFPPCLWSYDYDHALFAYADEVRALFLSAATQFSIFVGWDCYCIPGRKQTTRNSTQENYSQTT